MITIFVIYHKTFENTNIFTADENEVASIIKKFETDWPDTVGEWFYRKINQGEMFHADMNQ